MTIEGYDICQTDCDAADEVLTKYPVDAITYEARHDFIAMCHAYFNLHKFRLLFGLRQPNNWYEQRVARSFRDNMADDRIHVSILQYPTCLVDQRMIDDIFDGLDSCLESFSIAVVIAARSLHQVPETAKNQTENRASSYFKRTQSRFVGLTNELYALSTFLDEVRIEAHLGRPSVGQTSASNAVNLALLMFENAEQQWSLYLKDDEKVQSTAHYLSSMPAIKYLFCEHGPQLPPCLELQALLKHEKTAARLAVEKPMIREEPTS